MFTAGPAEPPRSLEPARAAGRDRSQGRSVGWAFALAAKLTVRARCHHLRRLTDSLGPAVVASAGAGSDAGGACSRVRFRLGAGMGTEG